MKNYEYISREYINPIDLDVLDKTLNTLQQGHQQAIAQSSALKLELAKLPLNESEEPYRNELLNKIENTMNENSLNGNYYYALDDITKFSGDLLSDRRLLSRVEAQEKYKNYQDYIDKLNLPEDYKAMYRAENSYYNNEEIDPNTGNVTKYTSWEPTSRPTEMSDMVSWGKEAVQLAAKQKGSYEKVYYKDADGNFTPMIEASVDGVPYYKIGTQYEKLTEEDVSKALKFIINNKSGARDSLMQDWKVAKYYHKEGDIDSTTDNIGIKLTSLDDYIEKRLTGFYDSVTYNHTYSSWDSLSGMSVKGKGNGNGNDSVVPKYNPIIYTEGANYFPKYSALSVTMGRKNAAESQLIDFAKDKRINIEGLSIDQIYKNIEQNDDISISDKKEAYMTYIAYNESLKEYNDKISVLENDEDKDAVEFVTSLEQGVRLETLNPENTYLKSYVSAINNLFIDGDTAQVNITDLNNTSDLARIIPDYENLGLEIKNGKLSIPKSSTYALYNIAVAMEPYLDMENVSSSTDTWGDAPAKAINKLKVLLNVYKDASKSVSNLVDEQSKLYASTLITEDDVLNRIISSRGDLKDSEIKSLKESLNSSIDRSLGSAGKENTMMGIGYTENGKYIPINYNNTGAQRDNAALLYSLVKAKDPQLISVGYDAQTLETQITVNMPALGDSRIETALKNLGLDENTERIIIKGDFIRSDSKDMLMSLPSFKYDSELHRLVNADVKNVTLNDDLNINLEINGDAFKIVTNDGVKTKLTKEQAKDALFAKDEYYSLKFDILNNNIPVSENASDEEITKEYCYNILHRLATIAQHLHPDINKIQTKNGEELNLKLLDPYMNQLYSNIVYNKEIDISYNDLKTILGI